MSSFLRCKSQVLGCSGARVDRSSVSVLVWRDCWNAFVNRVERKDTRIALKNRGCGLAFPTFRLDRRGARLVFRSSFMAVVSRKVLYEPEDWIYFKSSVQIAGIFSIAMLLSRILTGQMVADGAIKSCTTEQMCTWTADREPLWRRKFSHSDLADYFASWSRPFSKMLGGNTCTTVSAWGTFGIVRTVCCT